MYIHVVSAVKKNLLTGYFYGFVCNLLDDINIMSVVNEIYVIQVL